MTKQQMSPADAAFYKLYFVNMFQDKGAKFTTFFQAVITGNKMAKIANKMKPDEVKYLIDKIESAQ